eukprot:CAMPEP_0198277392 /NCGR_PEP_ID=MMETSP1447-20131203/65826_1 /TAXON_ID=420782 /ORGANISM="Chaetoceros dichaeta, Strain CCMP1751" /LENGTH=164 /DNA_ID=CAMNT_0043972411 /DNA_START=524 /DNA_END=1015 /DNA_ORIENTATION=-
MKQQKGCEWISTLVLQKVYCSSWHSGQMIRDACPKACNFCPAKLAGSAAISLSPLLFATHTTGSEEKQTEQRNERDDIFFARALDRRLDSTNTPATSTMALSAKPSSYLSTRSSSTVSTLPNGNPSNDATSRQRVLSSVSVIPSPTAASDAQILKLFYESANGD